MRGYWLSRTFGRTFLSVLLLMIWESFYFASCVDSHQLSTAAAGPLVETTAITAAAGPLVETTVIAHGPLVETEYGPVRGLYLESDGARAFYGVPFAAPPLDNLRWEPPRQPDSWGPEEWMATENPPGCPQICEGINPPIDCPEKTSEDCLYMNIFTPLEASTSSNLPVIIYIHGGGFTVNSAASPLFDGRFLAAMTTSVVVLANYRLGALGFLVPGNSAEGFDYHGYGIQDQRQAMKFVQRNIARFGGNPEQVTLVGQSVGAISIALHLTSNKSDSLFHQAILQSPPITIPFATVEEAGRLSRLVAEYLECQADDMECFRSKSADEIVMAQNYASGETFKWLRNIKLAFQPWGPVLRPDEANILENFAAGNFQKKPMILGGTADEARWNVFSIVPVEVPKIISIPVYLLLFGVKDTLRVLLKYPINSNSDVRDTLSEVLGDYVWTCSIRKATRDIESFETVPIYHYLFDHAVNDSAVWGFIEDWCRDYSCHTEDLLFLFYTLPLEGFSYTNEEKILAKSMIQYWGNFVHTGNPNTVSWRKEREQLFHSSKKSSILTHLETEESSSSNSVIQRFMKRGLKANQTWPTYRSRNRWSSMWFKTPRNDILHRYKAKYCYLWDTIGYQ